jgi:hypothetical protein
MLCAPIVVIWGLLRVAVIVGLTTTAGICTAAVSGLFGIGAAWGLVIGAVQLRRGLVRGELDVETFAFSLGTAIALVLSVILIAHTLR